MPRVLFKPTGHDTMVPIKCGASGRQDFGLYECHHRARKACTDGSAEFCLIIEGGQIIGKWERLPNGEVAQTAGDTIL